MKRARRARKTSRGKSPAWRRALVAFPLGIAATLATSAVDQQAVARYADIDHCVAGCTVAGAGWPLPYLLDYPGLSPVGTASLAGAFTGADRWRAESLAVDLVAWSLLAFVALALLRRARR